MGLLKKHDEVYLLSEGAVVGTGTLRKVLPSDFLHGSRLGDLRLGVMIDDVYDKNAILPSSSGSVRTLKEAFDMEVCVLWNISDVLLINDGKSIRQTVPDPGYVGVRGNDLVVSKMPFFRECTSPSIGGTSDQECLPKEYFNISDSEELGGDVQSFGVLGRAVSPCPKDDNWMDGDLVRLYILGMEVGEGIIHQTDATEFCHNVPIGAQNVSLSVVAVKEGHHEDRLRFSHDGAETLGEAIGTFVRWGKEDLSRLPSETSALGGEGCGGRFIETSPRKIKLQEEFVDYSQRRNWSMKAVELYCPDRRYCVGEGVVVAYLSKHCVDEKEVGDSHVGITLTKIHMASYFPDLPSGDIQMVAWPILGVKLVNEGPFLGDIIEDAGYNSEESLQVIEDLPSKTTRGYHSTKRQRSDPEASKNARREVKKVSKLQNEEIVQARLTNCCRLQCCHNTTLNEYHELRSDYWGSSFSDRKTYILALFQNRHKEHIAKNLMVLKSREVCKKAFHTIFGFSHTQFYKYQGFSEEGQRVGFHGNQCQLKTRENSMIARAMLHKILVAIGEPMPHLAYNQNNGTDRIEYRLPSSLSQMVIFEEVKAAMSEAGLVPIVKSTFYTIWRENFANYKMHTTSAFSKCDTCIRLKEALQYERRSKERKELEDQRAIHLQQQMSRRHLYYGARITAKAQPNFMLCIIHDKMDQNKTHLPKLSYHAKSLSGKGDPLPITLTGMITHGREPGAYAHYGLTGLWPSDPDYTITSITKCLRDLEEYSGDKSGHLGNYVENGCHPIFSQLLDQRAFQVAYLLPKNISVDRF